MNSISGKPLLNLPLVAVFLLLACGCRGERAPDGAGFAIPSCLAPVDRVLVTDTGTWATQIAGLPGLKPGQIVPVAPEAADEPAPVGLLTPWTTDQWVFGYRDGHRTALEMPAESGLADWGRKHFQTQGWPLVPVGSRREYPESRFDAGGNVLVVPAVPGRRQPARIITSAQVQPAIRKFLRQSSGSRPIELDTSWLKVGHVDEIVAIVPGGESGFRLVLPDPLAGLALLERVPADRILFGPRDGKVLHGRVSASAIRFVEDAKQDFGGGKWKYVRILSGPSAGLVAHVWQVKDHRLIIDRSWNLRGDSPTMAVRTARDSRVDEMPIWFDAPPAGSAFVAVEDSCLWQDGAGEEYPAFITAGELLRDPVLRSVAESVAKRLHGRGGVRDQLCRQLRIRDEDVIRLPVLLSGDPDNQRVVAYTPNPVNLVMVGSNVVLLKPFGPRTEAGKESSDVFESAWRSALAQKQLSHLFIDGWDAVHRQDGGAHCGMNVLRQVDP